MSLLEKFNNMPPGANATIFLRDMAAELDALATDIKMLPAYNPANAPVLVPTDTGSWTKAINSANGWGDVLNRLRGMAETVDSIKEWVERQNTSEEKQPMSVHDRMAKARAARGKAA